MIQGARLKPSISILVTAVAAAAAPPAAIAAANARNTATVRLIERVEPAVVAIFADLGDGRIGSGSGSIIHEDGFILSNDHVVHQRGLVLIKDRDPVPYQVVGRLPEKDLAIIKVPAQEPLPTIQLGRTHDLKAGEPILVAGNPGGRGIVFSSGIVSSPHVMSGNLLALISSRLKEDTRDRFIQFDAASNRGNSGGPLINAEGRQIGVVSSKNYAEENINYAIPIDRFRSVAKQLLSLEPVFNIHVGMEVDMFGPRPTIIQVAPKSPSQRAGFLPGDTLQSIGDKPIRDGIDWLLQLVGRKPGDTLKVMAMRRGQSTRFKLELGEFPRPGTVSRKGRIPGLHFELRHGDFNRTTEFARTPIEMTGTTDTLRAEELAGDREDFYGLTFHGYVDIPDKGLYRVTLKSDDGSRLFLDDKLAIDNDGRHPYQESSGVIRLDKGLVPIRVEYFEGYGEELLELHLQRNGEERILVGPEMFFRDPERQKASK